MCSVKQENALEQFYWETRFAYFHAAKLRWARREELAADEAQLTAADYLEPKNIHLNLAVLLDCGVVERNGGALCNDKFSFKN